MPKRRDRSVSSDRFTASPFLCSSSRSKHPFAESCLENEANLKEWEEARCPVCMEHPHNAILLLCSSHDKGCRPFMCDTSYRHSNCFDQFKKSFIKDPETTEQETISVSASASHLISGSDTTITNTSGGINEEGSSYMNPIMLDEHTQPKLMCPLCRGEIDGWIIVDPARCFMNAKARSCSCETCDFSGTYSDLRKHARAVHPSERPMVADPERQRNWNRLERRRDLGDLLSSLQSSIGGESNTDTPPEFDESNWLTVFFLVRVFRAGSNSLSNGRSVVSRTRVTSGRRSRRLLLESTDEEVPSGSRRTTVTSRRRSRRLLVESSDEEVESGSGNESTNIIMPIMPATLGDRVIELYRNALPRSNTRSRGRAVGPSGTTTVRSHGRAAVGPSGTTTVTSRRRLRRLREVSPDVEAQDGSSDAEIERSRRLRRRRRPSSEN